jgi:hypothetical protein
MFRRINCVLVGNADHPSTSDDVTDVLSSVRAVQHDPSLSLVTHHAVDVRSFSSGGMIDPRCVYKLGNREHPATEEDIARFQQEVSEATLEHRPIVWNHLLCVDFIDFGKSP